MTALNFRVYDRNGTFIESPTDGIVDYRHEHTEGPYIADFIMVSGEGGIDDLSLEDWFDNRLTDEISVRYDGSEVWRGIIWEMQLELNGEVRIKSMTNMANAIKTKYVNGSGTTVYTSWVTNDESIIQYGRRERVVNMSGKDTDEAEERADTELLYSASPYTTAIAYRDIEQNQLSVTAVGRQIAANNIQLLADSSLRTFRDDDDPIEDENDPLYDIFQLSDGSTTTVGEEIRRIVEVVNYWGGWLYTINIAANDTPTVAGVTQTIGAYDRLLELSKLRNTDGDFYRMTITNDGGVVYGKFVEIPDYFSYPQPKGLETAGGTVPTWDAKPGIIRTVDGSRGPALPDTWLKDKRHAFYERTAMKTGDKVATFHSRDFDIADILRAVEANQRHIEQHKPKKKTKKKAEPAREKDMYGHFV